MFAPIFWNPGSKWQFCNIIPTLQEITSTNTLYFFLLCFFIVFQSIKWIDPHYAYEKPYKNNENQHRKRNANTDLMVCIEKNTISAITNSYPGEMCSQSHYSKTCSSNSQSSHPLSVIIWETTNIKLTQRSIIRGSVTIIFIRISCEKIQSIHGLQCSQQTPRSSDQGRGRQQ